MHSSVYFFFLFSACFSVFIAQCTYNTEGCEFIHTFLFCAVTKLHAVFVHICCTTYLEAHTSVCVSKYACAWLHIKAVIYVTMPLCVALSMCFRFFECLYF